MLKQYWPHVITSILCIALIVWLVYFVLPGVTSVTYVNPPSSPSRPTTMQGADSPLVEPLSSKTVAVVSESFLHMKTPDAVKAIYMSQCVVGTPSFRDSLVKFIDESELNAVIIDVKDYTGKISFQTDNPLLKDAVSDECGALDMKEFVASLHQKNIYVIARLTTFQSLYYTNIHPEQAVQKNGGGVWKDHKGLAFVDVGAKPYWDYMIELGKETYAIGFDELNFDYIRFPSDGDMSQAVYSYDVGKSKAQVLEEFFKYLTENLRPTGAILSVDLFGMTATNEDDLNIGQVLERALPYFDYIDPMIYPSHYPSGYNGYKDVNKHSYDIVKLAMDTAIARAEATTTRVEAMGHTPIIIEATAVSAVVEASTQSTSTTKKLAQKKVSSQIYTKPVFSKNKIRPWLQSFDYPVPYTPAMVAEQIKATNDAGIESYLFWDASNKYTSLRAVLKNTNE